MSIMNEAFTKAKIKFETIGHFGVTAKDHHDLGGTPPDILENNPGKTKIDLYSDQDIEKELQDWHDSWVEFNDPKHKDSTFAQSYLKSLYKKILISTAYLRSINRLPEKFKNFDKLVQK